MDAFELLINDHQTVSQIFDRLEPAGAGDGETLFRELKQNLDLHAHIEETILYPALKEQPETAELTTHAYEEHAEVKQMLSRLEQMPKGSDDFRSLVSELRQSVEHHVKEEEGEMFQRARAALDPTQLAELGTRMQEEKQRQQGAMKAGA
jgi:iron-sulfur cluster repair protein YtfE (RIC family)